MYSSYISINKKFKSSINLQFDLNNLDKVDEYIPTTDLCDVIKKYLLSALGKNEDRSTLLVGPYGKGKSFLMLIITYIFSIKDKTKKAKEIFNNFLNRVRLVDNELADLILEIEREKIYLLPVIINSNNSADLNKVFMLSLTNTLESYGLESIKPNSTFEEALKLINYWENETNDGFDIFKTCIEKQKITLHELKQNLQNYDIDGIKQFESLYECISHGATFNPFTGNDFIYSYSSFVRELCKQTAYKGIFIIFDEFGFFLETQTNDFSDRLKNIQSLAEKCKTSDLNNQMHFCCITHKDFVLYSKENSLYDSFVKVSGRFKRIDFDRSLDENYDIISGAIKKEEEYNKIIVTELIKYNDLLTKINDTKVFSQTYDAISVFKKSFPFNPMALYLLVQVSEKIGQNERTLFTFLSDNDVNTFKYFIVNNSEGLINADYIYDYFENLIKNNNETYELYTNVEIAKKLCLKIEEHKIFKAIAVIKIINDNLKLPCTKENIALTLGCSDNSINNQIDELIKSGSLKENLYDKTIDFTVLTNRLISNQIFDTAETKFASINVADVINSLKTKKYYISHKYNFEYKMTRFFYARYLTVSDFKEFITLNDLFPGTYTDGLIINLLVDDAISEFEIKEKLEKSKPNIIIRVINESLEDTVIKKLKMYKAAIYTKENQLLSSNDKELVAIYLKDLTDELSYYFDEKYSAAKNICISTDSNNLEDCIYNTLKNYYSKTVIFNNEQVNKNVITRVTESARNKVIDSMLFNNLEDFTETSAEGTIRASFRKSLANSSGVIKLIKEKLIKSSGNKYPVSDLIKTLTESPYGMRKEIIPLFLTKAITELNVEEDTAVSAVLLVFKQKEIEINSSELSKVINNPNNYYLIYEEIDKEKYTLLKQLIKQFDCIETGNFGVDIKRLVNAMISYVNNLPSIYAKSNINDNLLDLSPEEIEFINLFLDRDLNNYEVLFNVLPNILHVNYDIMASTIKDMKIRMERKLEFFYKTAITYLKEHFITTDGSLYSSYHLWLDQHQYIGNIIFENKYMDIYKALNKLTHDDKSSINLLSNAIVKCTLNEWNTKKETEFYEKIDAFVSLVDNFDSETGLTKEVVDEEITTDTELSSLAETLYYNLSSILSEYGEAVSKKEIVSIIKKLLKETIE